MGKHVSANGISAEERILSLCHLEGSGVPALCWEGAGSDQKEAAELGWRWDSNYQSKGMRAEGTEQELMKKDPTKRKRRGGRCRLEEKV